MTSLPATPGQAPSPREDVREALATIEALTQGARIDAVVAINANLPARLRRYTDKVRNMLQVVEGTAAALENGEGK